MTILYIGDIVGKMGLEYFKASLPLLREKYKPNLVFVNAENVSKGKGLSLADYKEIMKLNVAGITMGNHTFRNPEINQYIQNAKIARPLNMEGVSGKGFLEIDYNGKKIALVNLIGTINLETNEHISNPFVAMTNFLKNHQSDYLIVDFHAEATSEKIAMGYFLDGIADVIVGTHTHVQTNDARVLEKNTLYLTDLGMTGPLNGVIGVDKDIIIDRFLNNGKKTFKLSDDGKCQLNGAFFDLDRKRIELIHLEK